jgi:cellulose synthase/poly-beta-1,6-N-acetylglucosamine synthase-like glycosyltransferase
VVEEYDCIQLLLASVIYSSLAILFYTYVGYPVLLAVWAPIRGKSVKKVYATPTVTVVIAAWNEVARIKARVKNCLDQDYPEHLINIVVVSDGSTDGTAEAVRSIGLPRVHVISLDRRMGKAQALNYGVAHAKGDVIVFADARQTFSRGALRELVANFSDLTVGAVTGELVLEECKGGPPRSHAGGLYWKIEKWIRKNEGVIDSTIGVTGAIYAIRKSLFRPLPLSAILDDLLLPMQIAMRGHRVTFEPQALAFDSVTNDYRDEFSRKVRTLAGNYQAMSLCPDLLLPWRNRLFFQFISHKVCRLIAPVCLLLLLLGNLGMRTGWLEMLLMIQIVGYGMALAGWGFRSYGIKERWTAPVFTFCLFNVAALLAAFHFFRSETVAWGKTSS